MQWLKTFSPFILFLRTSSGGFVSFKSWVRPVIFKFDGTKLMHDRYTNNSSKHFWIHQEKYMGTARRYPHARYQAMATKSAEKFFSFHVGKASIKCILFAMVVYNNMESVKEWVLHAIWKKKKQSVVYAAQFAIQCDTRDICKKLKTVQSQTLQIYLALISATCC